jgi:anti-sigma factor RsiW
MMERMKNNCTGMDAKLANLLLDPDAASAKVRAHVEGCDRCRAEFAELQATMALLDTWEGPEPSPYFLTRLDARLNEEREAEPAGWFDRLRARLVYGSRTHVRPLAAMALTLVLLLGGGMYLGVTDWDQPPQLPPGQAAVVHDLQTLDSNAQLLDELETLSSNQNGD